MDPSRTSSSMIESVKLYSGSVKRLQPSQGDSSSNDSFGVTKKVRKVKEIVKAEGDRPVERSGSVEYIRLGDIIKRLSLHWRNEKCAPRLLPHKEPLLKILYDQIETLLSDLSQCDDKKLFPVPLHVCEIHRLLFLANDYTRTRLKKIEEDTAFYLREQENRSSSELPELLSSNEKEFATSFIQLKMRYTHNCLARFLPRELQKFPLPDKDVSMNRVFVELCANEDKYAEVTDPTKLGFRETIRISGGAAYLLPYGSIEKLLEDGDVSLI